MSDHQEIAVSAAQIEACRLFIKGRLRGFIADTQYHSEPGAIAGLMSDLRALNFITPTDGRPTPVVQKAPTREEHDMAQRRAIEIHTEREKAALASG